MQLDTVIHVNVLLLSPWHELEMSWLDAIRWKSTNTFAAMFKVQEHDHCLLLTKWIGGLYNRPIRAALVLDAVQR